MLTITATLVRLPSGDVEYFLSATNPFDSIVQVRDVRSNLIFPEHDRHLEAYEGILIDKVRSIANDLLTLHVFGSRIVFRNEHVAVVEFDCGS